jgi:hypothetical protein
LCLSIYLTQDPADKLRQASCSVALCVLRLTTPT